jgi:hypothetical protein
MRRKVAFALAVCICASLGAVALRTTAVAQARPQVDYYITGRVLARAPGENAAAVEIKWDYKCLGDRLGPATFSWTLKLSRRPPGAERTLAVGSGTSKSGSRRVVVPPGRWQAVADPFRCETDRGAGSTNPEYGRDFDVPDYCGWTVAALKGRVTLEQRGSVASVRRGGTVTVGDTIATGRRSSVELRNRENASAVRVGANARVSVHRRHCPRTGAWKLVMGRGTLSAEVLRPAAGGRYELQSPNARMTTAGRAAWTVSLGRTGRQRWTRVAVRANRVAVTNARGRPTVVIRAGYVTIVRGSSPPSLPRRG